MGPPIQQRHSVVSSESLDYICMGSEWVHTGPSNTFGKCATFDVTHRLVVDMNPGVWRIATA